MDQLLYFAALGGLMLVYVMSRIYTLPTVAFWDPSYTLPYFASTMLLLGPATLFLLELVRNRRDGADPRRRMLVWQLSAVSLAFVFRMGVAASMAMNVAGTPVVRWYLVAHAVLLTLGAGTCLLMLVRAAYCTADGPDCRITRSDYLGGSVAAVALIWAAELFGRMAFYSGLTTYGM